MGPAGAWFADIAFLLFGASGYLFPILVLIAGVFLFRGNDLPEKAAVIWRGAGFLLVIATSSGLATLHFQSPRSARDRGWHSRPDRRSWSRVRARFARHDGAVARAVAGVRAARDRRLVDRDHGSHGPRRVSGRHRFARMARRRAHLVGRPPREAAARRGRQQGPRQAEDRCAAHRACHREDRSEPARERAARARAPSPDVRAAANGRAAGAVAARQSAGERGRLLARGAGSDVAARRAQAQRFRRRGRGRRRASRSGRHALRAEAGGGREEQSDQQSRQGSCALARDGQRARRRNHPGQAVRRPRDSERGARDRGAR